MKNSTRVFVVLVVVCLSVASVWAEIQEEKVQQESLKMSAISGRVPAWEKPFANEYDVYLYYRLLLMFKSSMSKRAVDACIALDEDGYASDNCDIVLGVMRAVERIQTKIDNHPLLFVSMMEMLDGKIPLNFMLLEDEFPEIFRQIEPE